MTARRAAGQVALLLALTVALAGGGAWAADLPSPEDIDAISHTLGFIDGMPHAGRLRIGVVYDGTADGGRAGAEKVIAAIAAANGPGNTRLEAVGISADDIAKAADVDALLLLPGLNAYSRSIIDAAAAHHLPTISTDPQCIEQQFCVLWVEARPRVTVTLNTKLADLLSVHVSPIFAMMVKRR